MRKAMIGLGFVVLLITVILLVSFSWRFWPSMRKNESYSDFFPREKFLTKVNSPVPQWMTNQLNGDFSEIPSPITASAVTKAYDVIMGRLKNPIFLYHYRIIDNQLYKYVPPGVALSSRDSYYEKAIKTLLSQIKIPDSDFLLCSMEGVPEVIVSSDFYLMPDPQDQVPILGQAKLREPYTHFVVLIPDQLTLSRMWYDVSLEILSLNSQIPWAQKIGKAFWRGGATDNVDYASRNPAMELTPRVQLCRLSKRYPDLIDATATSYSPQFKQVFETEGLLVSNGWVSKKEHLRYKYQPTINGNVCTYPGYQWRLLSNSLTLKQESFQVQWFYQALKPYVHYLPVAYDMSDLVEKIHWAETHENDVLQIVANAQQFCKDHLMYEDCYRYFYLVLQKYASLQKIDSNALKSSMKNDPHWINIQYRKRIEARKIFHRIFQKQPKRKDHKITC